MLKQVWKTITHDQIKATPPLENCGLHYIWINKHRDDNRRRSRNDPLEPLCTVPLDYIDRAYHNAQRYAETDFTLWVDFALIDDSSRVFLQSHHYLHAPENIVLRDLNEIPSYRDDPLFQPENTKNVFARTDYARLLVLAHDFKETDRLHSFYADFDVPDVLIRCPFAAHIMNRYGMFFGCTIEKDSILENSYMGFKRGQGSRFLETMLIPATRHVAEKDENGYSVLMQSLRIHEKETGVTDIAEKITEPRAPRSGEILPRNQDYIKHRII